MSEAVLTQRRNLSFRQKKKDFNAEAQRRKDAEAQRRKDAEEENKFFNIFLFKKSKDSTSKKKTITASLSAPLRLCASALKSFFSFLVSSLKRRVIFFNLGELATCLS